MGSAPPTGGVRTRVSTLRWASPRRGRQPLRRLGHHDTQDRHRDRDVTTFAGVPDQTTATATALARTPSSTAQAASPATEPATFTSPIRGTNDPGSSSRPARSPRSRARRLWPAAPTAQAWAPVSMSRAAWPSTGPATSSSRTAATTTFGRSSSRPGRHDVRWRAARYGRASTGPAPTPVSTGHPASPATEAETSTSPSRQPHDPEDRHRNESRHHVRGPGRCTASTADPYGRRHAATGRATSTSPTRRQSVRSSSRREPSPRSRAPPARRAARTEQARPRVSISRQRRPLRRRQPLCRRSGEPHRPKGRPRVRGRHHARGPADPVRHRRRDRRRRSFERPLGRRQRRGGHLYVADLGNTLIRKVDLATKAVTTLTPHLFNCPSVSHSTEAAPSTSPTASTSGRSTSRPGTSPTIAGWTASPATPTEPG